MSLVAEKLPLVRDWRRQSASQFLIHPAERGYSCCEVARSWTRALSRSFGRENQDGNSFHSPLWLGARFKWGPSPWPMHWCEAITRKELDCGALGILAREDFMSRGLEAYPAQVIQTASQKSSEQWSHWWRGASEGSGFRWVDSGTAVYHEVVLVVEPGSDFAKIYDPTEGLWMTSEQTGDHRVLAIRSEAPIVTQFEGLSLLPERWVDVGSG